MKGIAGLAALAAFGIIANGATAGAADLGGDCCADLEERIAELESTTARKGNRKVSLEVSGQVNEALLYWDDGKESNTYVVTNDNSRTRVRFKGKAKINADWEAGYLLEIGVRGANSKRFAQDDDDADSNSGLDIRDSAWFVKNKRYGAVWLGHTATATDTITEINLTQTKDFAKYSDVEDTGMGLFVRSATNDDLSRLRWFRMLGVHGDQPGDGDRRYDGVRYDSPEFAGFTISAFWGEDDYYDVGLRYAGEWAGFKVAAGFGYGKQTDGPETQMGCATNTDVAPLSSSGGYTPLGNQECHQYGGSFSVVHVATGLFVNFGAGAKVDDLIDQTLARGGDDSDSFWSLQAGIERKFTPLGATTIYGEYYDYNGGATTMQLPGSDAINPLGNTALVWGTDVQVWGAGIAQGINAAAMTLYLSYRHVEGDVTLKDVTGPGTADASLDDVDLVLAGGIIKF
jgi:predicted porin